ncbi:zinc finger, CCHC-type [Artemisia annua]|uniref:Zinc finger, CCHC-type n=1 Tax=Artemisia annua TaxID=35608 RepID=A0A2U1KJW7_ARTAN|nr:zinc finger, CCHC-type [Artemisia annua]
METILKAYGLCKVIDGMKETVPKKFLPIGASIEQYQEIDPMQFEEAVGRITIFEERLKIQDQKTIIKTNFYWQIQIIKEVVEDMEEASPKTKVAMEKVLVVEA